MCVDFIYAFYLFIFQERKVLMFKKIMAVGLSLSIIMTGTMLTYAAVKTEGQVVTEDLESPIDGVDTKDSFGVLADPDPMGIGSDSDSASAVITHDVTVTYDGEGASPPGDTDSAVGIAAKVEFDEDDTVKDAKASVEAGENVNLTNNSTTNDKLTDSYGVLASVVAEGSDESEGSKASASVKGNVTVTSTVANTVTDPESKDYEDISTTGVGVQARGNKTQASASVGGDVTVTSADGDSNGILAFAYGTGADAAAHIEGNVTSKSDLATGITALNANGGNIDVTIDKDLIVEGKNDAIGIIAMSGNVDIPASETTTITIGGNLTSSGTGMELLQNSGNIDIVIEGTLDSKGDSIVVGTYGEELETDKLNITVWKIENKESTAIVKHVLFADEEEEEDPDIVSDEISKVVEEKINYIIRIDEKQKDSISLQGLEKDKYGLYTAHANESVAVKLNIPSGYTLDGAYSDAEHTVALLTDDNGGYYLVVPSGGGITVSLALTKIISGDDDGTRGDSKNDSSNYSNYQNVPSLSDDAINFNQNNGILTITIQKGLTSFNLNSSVLLQFKTMGLSALSLDAANGKYTIPLSSIEDIVKEGNLLTFEFKLERAYVYVNGTLAREFHPDKAA